ncbi:response regulator transcription factor [Virgibacillus sp. C22-A2]|uniref:Heme response regulator HssR n=1 Tax=Virgibacillus tibetensis TaxID=3042313 RepID=A0ABU6KKI7_9BACI|nr:response regulator transcription factor [Virgibacillus sp. C22-A2]
MITILIVDDDPHIRELLRFYMQKEGYKTLEAADGKEALQHLDETAVHMTLVDIMMPNVDGYELCQEIRTYYDIPVLMITARGEISAGTDDYVVKPFDPKEVFFRIKALLRRFQMINEEIIYLGDTMINRKSYEVKSQGKTIILPLKEFELLAQLADFPNRLFSRELLIDLVWGNDYEGNSRTVDVHIKRLRERFCRPPRGKPPLRVFRHVQFLISVNDVPAGLHFMAEFDTNKS